MLRRQVPPRHSLLFSFWRGWAGSEMKAIPGEILQAASEGFYPRLYRSERIEPWLLSFLEMCLIMRDDEGWRALVSSLERGTGEGRTAMARDTARGPAPRPLFLQQ
jgi:hypothetical protein